MIPFVEMVRPYIYHYGYGAVFFGVFLESLGLPLPGETLIIVAGLVAAKGMLNVAWVLVLSVLATFLANDISYVIGYWAGRDLVIKYGKYVFLNESKLRGLESFIKQHGTKVLVFARFILGMRQFNGFIAGTVKMPCIKFAVYNFIGAVLWAGWWISVSYYFGKNFDTAFIKYYFFVGILAFVALVLLASNFPKTANSEISPEKLPAA